MKKEIFNRLISDIENIDTSGQTDLVIDSFSFLVNQLSNGIDSYVRDNTLVQSGVEEGNLLFKTIRNKIADFLENDLFSDFTKSRGFDYFHHISDLYSLREFENSLSDTVFSAQRDLSKVTHELEVRQSTSSSDTHQGLEQQCEQVWQETAEITERASNELEGWLTSNTKGGLQEQTTLFLVQDEVVRVVGGQKMTHSLKSKNKAFKIINYFAEQTNYGDDFVPTDEVCRELKYQDGRAFSSALSKIQKKMMIDLYLELPLIDSQKGNGYRLNPKYLIKKK